MRVGSLFSGIGGLDLGLERAGMTVVWQSEIDPYASKVLARHWPDVPNLGDITTVDWGTVERPDVVCGGYPCQPFSLAGVRRGEADPRHLWPHMLRAVRHLRPRYALLENVPGHLSMGFGRVLGDLAEIGYDCEWCCIPAAAVGAPHLRYRIFAVAYPHGESKPIFPVDGYTGQRIMVPGTVADTDSEGPQGHGRPVERAREWVAPESGATGGTELADTDSTSRSATGSTGEALSRSGTVERSGRCGGGHWDHWAVEPDVGRVAHGIPNRVDRLRCLGNAVVPQIAEWIGRQIMKAAAA